MSIHKHERSIKVKLTREPRRIEVLEQGIAKETR